MNRRNLLKLFGIGLLPASTLPVIAEATPEPTANSYPIEVYGWQTIFIREGKRNSVKIDAKRFHSQWRQKGLVSFYAKVEEDIKIQFSDGTGHTFKPELNPKTGRMVNRTVRL